MTDKQWTMNCILTGAQVFEDILLGRVLAAKETLRNLSPELTEEDIEYLIQRLKPLARDYLERKHGKDVEQVMGGL